MIPFVNARFDQPEYQLPEKILVDSNIELVKEVNWLYSDRY